MTSKSICVCGVSISSSTACFAVVEFKDGEIHHQNIQPKKISLEKDRDGENIKSFAEAVASFAHDNGINYFAIKTRQAKGPMSAGGVTFKIEALLQHQGIAECCFISPQAIIKVSKSNKGGVPASVLKYQEDAFCAAVAQLVKLKVL